MRHAAVSRAGAICVVREGASVTGEGPSGCWERNTNFPCEDGMEDRRLECGVSGGAGGRSWGPSVLLRRTWHLTQSMNAGEQDPQGSRIRGRVPPASTDPTRPDAPYSTQSRVN